MCAASALRRPEVGFPYVWQQMLATTSPIEVVPDACTLYGHLMFLPAGWNRARTQGTTAVSGAFRHMT